MDKMDKIYGCALGAITGDAAGVSLEFYDGKITDDVVQKAMTMPGGGIFRIGPGQISDDSELAFSLAFSIIQNKCYKSHYALRFYQQWLQSEPFDVGYTCSSAFKKPASLNYDSQSNGALMRIWPIAIFCANQSEDIIAHIAREDALVSHPNKVCQDCNVVYCVAIVNLINNLNGNHSECINHVKTYIQNEKNNICDTVKEWFHQAITMEDDEEIICKKNMGWCKWAFILAFHYLAKGFDYETSIRKTLLKGGDTDTNACIVGGLIGASRGISNIPDYMKKPVLEFDCSNIKTTGGQLRPKLFIPNHYRYICDKLVSL